MKEMGATIHNASEHEDDNANKTFRLLEFLKDISHINSRKVTDFKKYQKVLWLKDIQKLEKSYVKSWDTDDDSDIFVEIKHRKEPDIPTPPKICKEWYNSESLRQKEVPPTLRDSKITKKKNPHWEKESDEEEYIQARELLENNAAVIKAWDKYIQEEWFPWLEEHNTWEKFHSVYRGLFSIYQEILRLGENFELILGIGILSWYIEGIQPINRHLLVANIQLEFDAKNGKFTISPSTNGANTRLELDMLDTSYHPRKIDEFLNKQIDSIKSNPFKRTVIDEILSTLANSFDSRGSYNPSIDFNRNNNDDNPLISFAPAIIIRKRSNRNLTDVLEKIQKNIDLSKTLPSAFLDLTENVRKEEAYGHSYSENRHSVDEENLSNIYFPKPSNREQEEIVYQLDRHNGILVQGPPGTGKSHTIANLICHLLAEGKRILVTAKTPRALNVLKGLIPEEMRPLCINLVGTGREERKTLENSVSGILNKQIYWNAEENIKRVENLENALFQLKKDKATIENQIRDIKERESKIISVANGHYKGTIASVARDINSKQKNYHWFKDSIAVDIDYPFENIDVLEVLKSLRYYNPELRKEIEKKYPEDVPDEASLRNLFIEEEKLINEIKKQKEDLNEEILENMINLDFTKIIHFKKTAETLKYHYNQVLTESIHNPWIETVLNDVLNSKSSYWKEIEIRLAKNIRIISSLFDEINQVDVEYLLDITENELLQEMSLLNEYVNEGGKLTFELRCPKKIKDAKYIVKYILVDGRKCKTPEQLSIIYKHLKLQSYVNDLKKMFDTSFSQIKDVAQILELAKESLSKLQYALSLEEEFHSYQVQIIDLYNYGVLLDKDFSSIDINIKGCTVVKKFKELEKIKERIQECFDIFEKFIDDNYDSENDIHEVVYEMKEAIRICDKKAYTQAIRKINRNNSERDKIGEMDNSLILLDKYLPKLHNELLQTHSEKYWDERFEQLSDAWFWKQAKTYITEQFLKEDIVSLEKRLRQIDQEIHAKTASIASDLSWDFCFSRLEDQHRREMISWQQSIKKLGKGTGKYANQHRREARMHLNNCHEAVPAWVMPLHRIWDTVEPDSAKFDVIIVDEASQCGLEALPLFYLGKKIVIVGDDKQISPDAVGINRQDVNQLKEKYLYDFSQKTSFNVEQSLFDQGELRFGKQKITLREHFRCMPEIIEFSNSHFYTSTPLIPLRQFGVDRLEPLEKIYVKDGYREGRGGKVINRVEAEALCNYLVKMCKNPRYKNKTMGVIVLQGEAQANIIENMLLQKLGAEEMGKREIICGNPYSFQGDERDIMLLSMVAAPNERIGVYNKASDERRFNVAASRAKDQMILFHSVLPEDLSSECLRKKILEFFYKDPPKRIVGIDISYFEKRAFKDNRMVIKAPDPFDSWFEVDVALEIARRGYVVIPQYAVAGKFIDLIIQGGNVKLAVECDGENWHGIENYDADMFRQRQLERCGWEFYRIRESLFYVDKEAALKELWELLDERGIKPRLNQEQEPAMEQ